MVILEVLEDFVYRFKRQKNGMSLNGRFILMVTLNHLVQHNKQQHRKVLLSSFHLNGYTLGFHPQTQKIESHREE